MRPNEDVGGMQAGQELDQLRRHSFWIVMRPQGRPLWN